MKRHIIVTKYSKNWPLEFKNESKKIEEVLKKNCIEIHHIGSTSVPNLMAKPTIDIMPVVKTINDVDLLKWDFESIGYEYLGEYGIKGRRYLRKVKGETDLFHIHIFEENNKEDIIRHIAVRDYLINNKEIAKEYEKIKVKLAENFPYNINEYCDGKDSFVKKMEKNALKWYKIYK